MSKVFRKIRMDLLQKNNTTKYLKYALGEIALVMIGILLALQINNWNEERKAKKELQSIFKSIALDLKQDTLVAKNIITLYDTIQSNSQKLINGKINKENYKNFPMLRSLVSVYSPFSVQTKGFEMLKSFSNQNEIQNDTLATKILQFYTPLLQLVSNNNELIKKEVLENIDDFKSKSWFVDWSLQKFTPEMIDYFTASEDYRKKVAANLIFAVANHKKVVEVYKLNASKLIALIDKKVNQQ